MIIQIVIVVVAIWAPWVQPWNIKLRMSTLEWLALEIGRSGIVTFAVAVPVVIIFGAILAAIGALLRVWGAAYLGYDVVHHAHMQAGGVMAAGPYRYMRNPLYLGGWFMMAAISLLFTPSGALFMVVLIGVLLSAAHSGRRSISCYKTWRALSAISACCAAHCAAISRRHSCG